MRNPHPLPLQLALEAACCSPVLSCFTRWSRCSAALTSRDAAPETTRDYPRLPEIAREFPRAHSQADLALPAPVMLPLFVAILPKLPGEAGGAAGQRAYTSRVCEGVARRVIEVMQAARRGWKEGAGRPRPKAVVFSEFDNDLSQVSSHLTGTLGHSRAISGNLGQSRAISGNLG